MVPLAAGGPASGSAHWAITGLEIALALALFAVGLLIDRRAGRSRRTTGDAGVRAIAHTGAPISVALQVSGAHAAGPLAGRPLANGATVAGPLGTGPSATSPLSTELVAARAGDAGAAGDRLCGGDGRC
jgi:hypothetical protein